jgi:hypothetical protein
MAAELPTPSPNPAQRRLREQGSPSASAMRTFRQLTAAALDTFDFVKIPAGAQVVEGFICLDAVHRHEHLGWAFATRTAPRRAAPPARTFWSPARLGHHGPLATRLRFKPFTNDADTIAYAPTSGPAHTALDNATLSGSTTIANGTK